MDKEFENEFTEKMLSLCIRLETVSKEFFKKKKNQRLTQSFVLLIDVIINPNEYTETSITFYFQEQAIGIEKLIKDLWTLISNYDFKRFLDEVEVWRHRRTTLEMYSPLIQNFKLDLEERFETQERYILSEFGTEKIQKVLFSKGFSQS